MASIKVIEPLLPTALGSSAVGVLRFYHWFIQWNLVGMVDDEDASAARGRHRLHNPEEQKRIILFT